MAGWDNSAKPDAEQLRAAIRTTKANIRKIDKEHKTQARQRTERRSAVSRRHLSLVTASPQASTSPEALRNSKFQATRMEGNP